MKTIKIDIPKGKEAHDIVATPHSGYIEVNYELKDSWTPKDGDFVSLIDNDNIHYLIIYKQKIGFEIESYVTFNISYKGLYICSISHDNISIIRPATEEEKRKLLDRLHESGKDWDAENKKIIPYRWKPKKGDCYYSVLGYMGIYKYSWSNDSIDNRLYNCNNCFQTKEEAEAMRDRLQKVLNGAKLKGE